MLKFASLKLALWELRLWGVRRLSGIAPTLSSKIFFRIFLKKRLDLKNPRTLNEKIMWLKLNTYKDNFLVTKCIDKVEVRDYVSASGLNHILVPLIHVWHNVDDIVWDDLPNSFALKCNHGCGYNILCYKKSTLDTRKAKALLERWMEEEHWRKFAEINYKNIHPKILCEKYLRGSNDNLPPEDYKLYCFNGQAKYILLCKGRECPNSRNNNTKFYFFDINWKLAKINSDSILANEDLLPTKPEELEDMIKYANILSKPFPFVRIDFYLVFEEGWIGKKIYFGEMTFTPSSGLDYARLPETDLMFGDMVDLNYMGANNTGVGCI